MGGDDFVRLPHPGRPALRLVIGRDLQLVLVGAIALLMLMIAGEGAHALQPLRLILGTAYILYVPGYCVVSALFAHADDLDGIERAGLSMGLSIALVPALALLLDRLSWGIRVWPILMGTYAIILTAIAVAAWRRARLVPESRSIPHLQWRPRAWWRSVPHVERRAYILLACALVIAGSTVVWSLASAARDRHMTELYILGRQGLAEDYPRGATVTEDLSVTLGIANREGSPRVYQVEVWAVDPWQPGRRSQVYLSGPLALAAEEVREWPISWRMPWAGDDQTVEILLFSGSRDKPYRQLRLWMNVTDGH